MKPKHGGNTAQLAEKAGCLPEQLLDFSSSVNPLGPPEWLRMYSNAKLSDITKYPDPECKLLKEAISKHYEVPSSQIVIGNGSSEILYHIPRALKPKDAIIVSPGYTDYSHVCFLEGIEPRHFVTEEENGFLPDLDKLSQEISPGPLVILGNPNNPSGSLIPKEALISLIEKHPTAYFLIDEAFIDFLSEQHSLLALTCKNVIVLRSLTKFYTIPGLRLGFAVTHEELASQIENRLPTWSVNTLAQELGRKLIEDAEFKEKTRKFISEERMFLKEKLESIPSLKVFPSKANFLLVKILSASETSKSVFEKLLKKRIEIRGCEDFLGLDSSFFRVSIKKRSENEELIASLKEIFCPSGKGHTKSKKTPALMLQGTASSVGKSLLTAAFCRIFLQDGLKVSPFKSQNMSNNSWVTQNGEEIARSQAVQAQAAKLEPDIRMNPILLKPTSDKKSQVIIRGKATGTPDFIGYSASFEENYKTVCEDYDSLSREYEVMVLEGAGSSAEVNLKSRDLVNMKMARHADAAVVIVGDIDRGGVFASFVGMMTTFAEWERELVKGFLVNRFRGEASLLTSAYDYVQENLGKPVLGTIPWIRELNIPEEDGVQFSSACINDNSELGERIDIALIGLGRVSNFNDIDPLRLEEDVRLRLVWRKEELGSPDVVIIPGSRNVIEDMRSLDERDLSSSIRELASSGKTEVIGLCGGYQMLGTRIADPLGIESPGESVSGLELLDITSELRADKTVTRAEALHLSSRLNVLGYQIHHGETSSGSCFPLIQTTGGKVIGHMSPSANVWGTYLHGIFDDDSFRRWFINQARERKNLPPISKPGLHYSVEAEFDRLADIVRESVDMNEIYKVLNL